jgi:hypothetical protein
MWQPTTYRESGFDQVDVISSIEKTLGASLRSEALVVFLWKSTKLLPVIALHLSSTVEKSGCDL